MPVSINLLPEALQKPKALPAQQLLHSPLAFLLGGGLLAAVVLLVLIVQVQQVQLGGINARLKQLAFQKADADELSTTVKNLKRQQALYQNLSRRRTHWAKRLNTLSDVTPDGMWYVDLILDPKEGLVLRGAQISQTGTDMVRIGQLEQDLKNNSEFSSAFRNIQVGAVERQQDGAIELVEFTLKGEPLGASGAR